MPSPSALAALVPDEPAWIDLGGLLRSERCEVFSGDDPEAGFVAVSWDFPFAALRGAPGEAALEAAIRDAAAREPGWAPWEEPWSLLAQRQGAARLRGPLAGWSERPITILRPAPGPRPVPWAVALGEPPEGIEIRVFAGGAAGRLPLAGLPGPLRHELSLEWVGRRPLAAALEGGRPVAVCSACFESESWWDVGVETLEGHRRRGLAARCFLALEEVLRRAGKRPAWGAHDDNPASLGLAARLGFEPCDKLLAFSPPT